MLSPLCFANEINYKDFDFLDLDIDKIKSDFYLRQIEKYINLFILACILISMILLLMVVFNHH